MQGRLSTYITQSSLDKLNFETRKAIECVIKELKNVADTSDMVVAVEIPKFQAPTALRPLSVHSCQVVLYVTRLPKIVLRIGVILEVPCHQHEK